MVIRVYIRELKHRQTGDRRQTYFPNVFESVKNKETRAKQKEMTVYFHLTLKFYMNL